MYIVELLNMIGWNLNSLNPTYNKRKVIICTLKHYGRKAVGWLASKSAGMKIVGRLVVSRVHNIGVYYVLLVVCYHYIKYMNKRHQTFVLICVRTKKLYNKSTQGIHITAWNWLVIHKKWLLDYWPSTLTSSSTGCALFI